MPAQSKKIVIAGATGFVGEALVEILSRNHEVTGLSRKPLKSEVMKWQTCDLFSLLETEQALVDCDTAIYLVHSMLPSARLNQATFEDTDLLLADNFSRAARKNKVRKIIYLGGIIPSGRLSRHLESRYEVEQILKASGTLFYGLRAGLIIGQGGSSFNMMLKLIGRLPVMICPKWTANPSQPIALNDVTAIIEQLVLRDDVPSNSYDIGGADVLSYTEIMGQTAEIMGFKRRFIQTPFFSLTLSKLWVSVISSTPMSLVSPLVESLKHQMVPRDLRMQTILHLKPTPFREAVASSLRDKKEKCRKEKSTGPKKPVIINFANSIQRLKLPHAKDANWVSKEYAEWLVRSVFRPVIRVEFSQQGMLDFYLICFNICLLKLKLSERSSPDRTLFYIVGGILDKNSAAYRGRLEFREVLDKKYIMASVYSFSPKLPWIIYKYTQAIVHLLIMRAFGRHLKKII